MLQAIKAGGGLLAADPSGGGGGAAGRPLAETLGAALSAADAAVAGALRVAARAAGALDGAVADWEVNWPARLAASRLGVAVAVLLRPVTATLTAADEALLGHDAAYEAMVVANYSAPGASGHAPTVLAHRLRRRAELEAVFAAARGAAARAGAPFPLESLDAASPEAARRVLAGYLGGVNLQSSKTVRELGWVYHQYEEVCAPACVGCCVSRRGGG